MDPESVGHSARSRLGSAEMKQVLAPAFALALAGCGHTQPPVTVAPRPPPDCIACSVAIVLDDDMGSGFRLERIEARLDGDPLYARADPDHLHEPKSLELARDLKVSSGRHVLDLHLVFHGWGMGVFSYLRDYKFKVASTYDLWPRKGLVLHVHAFEKGGPTTPLEERPAVRYEALVE
jgi:hypothetical protein